MQGGKGEEEGREGGRDEGRGRGRGEGGNDDLEVKPSYMLTNRCSVLKCINRQFFIPP